MNGNGDQDEAFTVSSSSFTNQLNQIELINRRRSNTLFSFNSISSTSDSLFDETFNLRFDNEGEESKRCNRIERIEDHTSNLNYVGRNKSDDRSLNSTSNDYTPPSSLESNSDTYHTIQVASYASVKGKSREIETKGKGKSLVGNSLEIERHEEELLTMERTLSRDNSRVEEEERVLGDSDRHKAGPSSSSTIFPASFVCTEPISSDYSTNYSSLPTSPLASPVIPTLPNPEEESTRASSNSPKLNRIKRSFSFSRPPLLFNKNSRSFSNLSFQLNSNQKSAISSSTTSPTISTTGTPGRNTSLTSLLVLVLNNPPDSPAESTTSSRRSWRVRSKEKLSKVLPSLPKIKRRNSTLPLSTNVQSLLLNSSNGRDISEEQALPVEIAGFPFPRSKPRPSRSISAPILFSHSVYSKYNIYGEFITAPSTPNNEEIVEQRSKLNFDQLPRELKVRIFGEILNGVQGDSRICLEEVERLGRRDLVKIGRVSKSWLSLSLDSQLWSNPDFSLMNCEGITVDGIKRIIRSSGIYIKSLDLKGCKDLAGKELISGFIFGMKTHDVLALSLVNLNLTGCTSLVSTVVSQIFMISPFLINVNLFALDCINEGNIVILGKNAPSLLSLNISRCLNLDPSSLVHINPNLHHLWISGLCSLLDSSLVTLAHRFTQLITLDISFSPSITDQAFASITTPTTLNPFESITIDYPFERKRPQRPSISKSVLPWRHLIVSGCKSITASTFVHLSHSLASLEILEVSRMGRRLGTGIGNVDYFLSTTPKLRKLDLENSVELTDSVLKALIPSLNVKRIRGLGVLGGCPDLETLVISTCTAFSNEAILLVVRGCIKLTTLEADGTNIEEDSAKEFINGLELKNSNGTLTILDNRTITVQLYEGLNRFRTRNGRRSYWTQQFKYHDQLHECDEERIVIRSSHTNALVDQANLEQRMVGEIEVKKSGLDWESLSKCTIS